MNFDLLHVRKIGPLTPAIQIILICFLYLLTIAVGYMEYTSKGTMFGYPLSISILFVPLYEEILFRGLILGSLEKHVSKTNAIVLTSIFFGLWHLKNIFFLSPARLAYQIFYTAVIFSPIASWMTLKTKTMWPAVIVHYLNNLLSPLSWIFMAYVMH